MTIHRVNVFPSNERLAIGVDFSAKAEKANVLDTNGTIYLLGKPVLDARTQTLSFGDVTFSRILDNDLWNAVSLIFRGQIVDAIEKSTAFPLEPSIRDGRMALLRQADAAAKSQGINLAFRDDFVGLKQVNLAKNELEVLVGLEGTADVVMMREPTRNVASISNETGMEYVSALVSTNKTGSKPARELSESLVQGKFQEQTIIVLPYSPTNDTP